MALLMFAGALANMPEPVRVGVLLEAPRGTRAEILTAFRGEVERIVERPGAELHWRERISGGEAFDRVVVIRLRGACVSLHQGQASEPFSLGSTQVIGGRVQPFVDVSCPEVMTAISRGWYWPGRQAPAALIGRALARVAAHEVFHALTESVEHDEAGLMKPAFDRHDMCVRKLEMAPASAARLERALGVSTRRAGSPPSPAF